MKKILEKNPHDLGLLLGETVIHEEPLDGMDPNIVPKVNFVGLEPRDKLLKGNIQFIFPYYAQ